MEPRNPVKGVAWIAFGIACLLVADLFNPERQQYPVCAHEDYWRRKAERRGR